MLRFGAKISVFETHDPIFLALSQALRSQLVKLLQGQLHTCRALLGPWPPPGPPCVPEGGGWGTGPRGGPPRPPPIAAPLSPNKFVNSLKLDTKNHIGTYMYIHFP